MRGGDGFGFVSFRAGSYLTNANWGFDEEIMCRTLCGAVAFTLGTKKKISLWVLGEGVFMRRRSCNGWMMPLGRASERHFTYDFYENHSPPGEE